MSGAGASRSGTGGSGRSPDDVVVVLVTGPDRSALRALSRTLAEERLIACANLVEGLTSIFRWKGAIEEEGEALALLKTTRARLPELEARVRALHPYDVPEVLALEAAFGSRAYVEWVRDCVAEVEEDGDPDA